MYEYFAKRITNWLIDNNAIEKDDRELYEYAVISLLVTIAPLFIVIPFGIITGLLKESICLVIPFMTIRKYSGGYHASSTFTCLLSSCVLILLFLFITSKMNCGFLLHGMLFLSSLSLILLSPVDSENKKLSLIEKKQYKRLTCYILIFFWAVYLILFAAGIEKYAVPVALGLVLSASLQIPCIPKLIKEKKAATR